VTSIADRLFALLWVIVGIVAVVAAGDISGGGANAQDALGPRVFPEAIGIILAGLGLWLLLSEPLGRLFGWSRPDTDSPSAAAPEEPAESSEGEAVEPAPPWRVPAAIAVTIAYVALLPVIHYLAATLIASIAMLFLLGVRRISVLVLYPLALTFAAKYAFTEIVGVILP
jgi:Tripartite tricarboxylate transporter TctB family